jgi:hypothetical protein
MTWNRFISTALLLTTLLLFSFVPGAPGVATGADRKSIAPTKAPAVVQESATQSPTSGLIGRRTGQVASPSSLAALSDRADDLLIDASLGDENIVLERKKKRRPQQDIVIIKLNSVSSSALLSRDDGGPPMIDLRATITGEDAVQGSLPYALAWLAGNTDPLASVRALGYDIDVSKEHEQACTNGPPGPACVEHARRLATLLDATLALGSSDERAQFRQDAAALGVAPDCVAPEPES